MPRQSRPSASMKRISPEALFALGTGAFTLFSRLLPVVTFWFRFVSLAIFVALVLDLCLRSENTKHYFASPWARLLLSILACAVIVTLMWNPMRTQYMEEHLPPSFPYIVGAPLGDSDSPVWAMMIHHFGSKPVSGCEIEFRDEERKVVEYQWLRDHPGMSYPPPGLAGESQKVFSHLEADPLGGGFGDFRWSPLNPNHQHYTAEIKCPDGRYEEDWRIVRLDGTLATEISVERSRAWLERNPELEQKVFSCGPMPTGVETPYQSHGMTINPAWQANRVYTVPVVIIDPDNHMQILKLNNVGCWTIPTQHFGDPHLPLTFSTDNPLEIAAVVYGLLGLVLPLYCLFAFWLMGEDLVKS